MRSPPQDEISEAKAVRHLRDDEVDRLEVEELRDLERTSTNRSRTLPKESNIIGLWFKS